MVESIPPIPAWVPRLWTRSDPHRRLLGVIESPEEHEAYALLR